MQYKELTVLAGISDRGIRDVLEKHEIPKRARYRKYKVNEDFFKTWSNEMAWILGLFVTDGHIYHELQAISFVQKDEDILRLVAKYMEADYRVYKNNRIPQFMIGSKTMKNDLMDMGIFSRKSNTILFPDIPQQFMSHFIRGVIDGDGWVQTTAYTMNVTTGSEDFANGLLDVFESWELNSYIKKHETPSGRDIFRVFVSGKNDVAKLASIVYKNCGDCFVSAKRLRMSLRLIEEVEKKIELT